MLKMFSKLIGVKEVQPEACSYGYMACYANDNCVNRRALYLIEFCWDGERKTFQHCDCGY